MLNLVFGKFVQPLNQWGQCSKESQHPFLLVRSINSGQRQFYFHPLDSILRNNCKDQICIIRVFDLVRVILPFIIKIKWTFSAKHSHRLECISHSTRSNRIILLQAATLLNFLINSGREKRVQRKSPKLTKVTLLSLMLAT